VGVYRINVFATMAGVTVRRGQALAPGHMQGWVAGLYMMSPEPWAAAAFLARAADTRHN
jgi:hypothetical protein